MDALLAQPAGRELLANHPRTRVVQAIRDTLARVREDLTRVDGAAEPGGSDGLTPSGSGAPEAPGAEDILERVRSLLDRKATPSLRPVVNATGVVLHTNLGRAPLSSAAREAMARAAHGYSNLEYDLESGRRGSRYLHCVELLKEITGAPDALVVNNNAAAVVLGLNTLAEGRGVLISRGELVEIGGGFRIPDMLSRSGARLREVGTTNRTRVEDYREAAEDGDAAAILKVHRSNFKMSGFTEDAPLAELVPLARALGLALFHDLGSGLLLSPARLGLPPEPTAMESLQAGADAVAISGDKLLGGPQAGILLGDTRHIESMRKNPLCRAFRVDKVTLAGLEATLRHYLDPEEALREIPALRSLATPVSELAPRAQAMVEGLTALGFRARSTGGFGMVGGGTFPGTEIPTVTVRVDGGDGGAEALAAGLRLCRTPVVARVDQGDVVLDLRVIRPDQDAVVLSSFQELSPGGEGDL